MTHAISPVGFRETALMNKGFIYVWFVPFPFFFFIYSGFCDAVRLSGFFQLEQPSDTIGICAPFMCWARNILFLHQELSAVVP